MLQAFGDNLFFPTGPTVGGYATQPSLGADSMAIYIVTSLSIGSVRQEVNVKPLINFHDSIHQ